MVRSTLHRHEVSPTGKRTPEYRTGLEFPPTLEHAGQLLAEYIESLKGQS